MDNEGWIKVLEERIEGVRLQVGRLISHFDSEQRTSIRHGKDIDHILKQLEKKDQDWKFWIAIGVSIVSTIIAIFK